MRSLARGGRRSAACCRRLLAPAALIALAAGGAAAAAQEAGSPTPFGESVDVRVVNVEVVVTERGGRRVGGLRPEDFRLRVDGEEVPIAYFTEVREGEALTIAEADDGERRSGARGAAEPVPEAQPSAAGGAVGTSYLVFVDDFKSGAPSRNLVLQGLADDLGHLGPDDRVAVVAFDGKGLHRLTPWTSSPTRIREALEIAETRPCGGGARHWSQLGPISTRRIGGPSARTWSPIGYLEPQDLAYAQRLVEELEWVVDGAVAAMRAFSQAPGRRVMLLLSGGWPFSPGAFAVDRFAVPRSGGRGGEALFRPLVDTANLLGYTLYPVDLPGFSASAPSSAEFGGLPGPIHSIELFARVPSGASSAEQEGVVEETLSFLAAKTGGRALFNSQRRDALRHVAADTRSYYWLGFVPERREDGRRHRIEVDVRRRGVRVRSRESFVDLSTAAERGMEAESALLFGSSGVESALKVFVGEGRATGRRGMEVPLEVAIPVDDLAALPDGAGGSVVRAELRIAALDGMGRQSPVAVVPLQFRLPEGAGPGVVIHHATTIGMRRADQVLVVHLTDALTGGSLTGRVTVAAP